MEEVVARFYAWSVIVTTLVLLIGLIIVAVRDAHLLALLQRTRRLRWLASTRLHAVLVRRGISPARYVRQTAPSRMVEQLLRCEQCAHHRYCDDSINSFAQTPPVAPCPNRAAVLAASTTI